MAFSVVGRVTEGAKLTTQQVAPILPQAKHCRQLENNGVPEPELSSLYHRNGHPWRVPGLR